MEIIILKIVLALLVGSIAVFLIILNQKQRIQFQKKANRLTNAIETSTKKREYLNKQIKLSDEFDHSYKDARSKIAQTVYDLNKILFEKISARNKNRR